MLITGVAALTQKKVIDLKGTYVDGLSSCHFFPGEDFQPPSE